jgi:hypothetical protein
MAHLSDDETVAKMGHPDLDVGHPPGGVSDSEYCSLGEILDRFVLSHECSISKLRILDMCHPSHPTFDNGTQLLSNVYVYW